MDSEGVYATLERETREVFVCKPANCTSCKNIIQKRIIDLLKTHDLFNRNTDLCLITTDHFIAGTSRQTSFCDFYQRCKVFIFPLCKSCLGEFGQTLPHISGKEVLFAVWRGRIFQCDSDHRNQLTSSKMISEASIN